jgi:hypothetical protein
MHLMALVSGFQSLPTLEAKMILLVLFLSLVGWSLASLTHSNPDCQDSRFPWLLSLPLGFALISVVLLVGIRVMIIGGRGFLAVAAGAGVLAGIAVVGLAFRCGRVRRSDLRRSRVLILCFITVCTCTLTLMPMCMEPRLRYFVGPGTDSTGYTRVAQAMAEGWYFKVSPAVTLEDRLYRPARRWPYEMKTIEDRPGTYGLIGVISLLLCVNVMQAYLLTGALACVLCANIALCAANIAGWCRPWRFAFAAMGLLLIPASGLVANFYDQFLAQVICTSVLVAVVPAIVVWMLHIRPGLFSAFAGPFAASLLVTYFYDTRFALAVLCSIMPTLALCTYWRFRRVRLTIGRSMAALAGCVAPPLFLHSRMFMFGNVPQFQDQTPLSAFLLNAGLGVDRPAVVLFYLLLAILLCVGLANSSRFLKRFQPKDRVGVSLFVLNVSVLMTTLSIVLLMAFEKNPYAMKKAMFFLLPPAITFLVYCAGLALAGVTRTLRIVLACLFGILVLVASGLSLYRQRTTSSFMINSRNGTITTEVTAQLEKVTANPHARVVLDIPILHFLQIAEILDDTGHAIFAPFSSWRHSATDLPEGEARRMHGLVENSAEGTRAGDTYYFSLAPVDAPPVRVYIVNLVHNAHKVAARDIDFDVIFPNSAGGVEPLITAGHPGYAFFLYVEYLPDDTACLKFKDWGSPTVFTSEPFSRAGRRHHLSVQLSIDKGFSVVLDGIRILDGQCAIHPDQTAEAVIGANNIGGVLTTLKFTGKFTNVAGL